MGDDKKGGSLEEMQNQAQHEEQVAQYELDSEMEFFPVKAESFGYVGDWFGACRSAGILVPVQLGHAVTTWKKSRGSDGLIHFICFASISS